MAVLKSKPLRLGYVPLIDCAPLVMAQELGLYTKYDLRVTLSREPGWATIRDKILYGDLEAAHALAVMPFAATMGLGSIRSDCVTGLVLNLHGNAITLSQELRQRGVRDARTLRGEIERNRGRKSYTFGVVFQWSSHNFVLRHWLSSAGIDPDKDVRIVVVPPPAMFINLKAGNLDGYCVGEPWNSIAVESGDGWCPSTSAQLAPGHPEKVLMVRREFTETHASEHLRLIAALVESCAYCEKPGNRDEVASVLARPEYVNAPLATLRRSLCIPFHFGGDRIEPVPHFHQFAGDDANEPSIGKAQWILEHLLRLGAIQDRTAIRTLASGAVFRTDLFEQARMLVSQPNPLESNTTDVLELAAS
jgi:ABC-type nitrate/sulfonate/bicarbonate transport system substrate-binding protein